MKIKFESFLGLISFSELDHENEIIKVYEESIKEIMTGLGEGVYDVTQSGNDVYVTFYDNAWGGIDLSEWNKANETLEELKGEHGLYDFSINPGRNEICLEFSYKGYVVEIY